MNQINKSVQVLPDTSSQTFKTACGAIPYDMTNDYMFRAVLYLCRSFDAPKHGEDYLEIRPAVHVGFLDYTLFEEYPEFYAIYKLANIKNNHVYSDTLILSVVDLSRIDLATEEDKAYGIDYRATLFKAKTWEEIKIIASKDKDIEESARTLFQFCTDEQIRKLCWDREKYYQDIRSCEHEIEKMNMAIAERDMIISSNASAFAKKNKIIAEKDSLIEELLAELDDFKK